jgi:hypothetical protein
MEIKRLIKENQINDYVNLKLILESSEFNLKIKEDTDFPTLFLIHTQDTSNFNVKLVNECNGLIMDKNTLEIVCYSFDKCSDSTTIFDASVIIDFDDLYIEKSLEGTLIRLYYYNNKWNLSTKKCIDASKSKWLSEKNFTQLFNECIQNYNIMDNLNTSYCYSFIITHPENNIIVIYTTPIVYHVSTRDMTTLNEIDVKIGLPKNERLPVMKSDLNIMLSQISSAIDLTNEGYLFIDTNFNRWKIKTEIYKYVRNLWGNSNNRFYRYLELRKDNNLLHEYIKYFDYDRHTFIKYETKISTLAENILKIYVSKHITKDEPPMKTPYFFAKIIYKLHGDYYKDKSKTKTNYNKVMMVLIEMDPKQVCFMINHYEKYIDNLKKENDIANAEYEITEMS